jgi:hypothetical protein
MRCLTYFECAEWCLRRDFPTRQIVDSTLCSPELNSPPFNFIKFKLPNDSGAKVGFAHFLYSLIDPVPDLLLWLGDWSVWPSSAHMPLFTRFREAHGERRSLDDAPGQLLKPGEPDDAISIIVMSLQFVWNCHILASSGRDAAFVSHDEYGWFASRDEAAVDSARRKIKETWKDLADAASR